MRTFSSTSLHKVLVICTWFCFIYDDTPAQDIIAFAVTGEGGETASRGRSGSVYVHCRDGRQHPLRRSQRPVPNPSLSHPLPRATIATLCSVTKPYSHIFIRCAGTLGQMVERSPFTSTAQYGRWIHAEKLRTRTHTYTQAHT